MTLIKIQTGLEDNKITKKNLKENFTLKKEKVNINTIDNYLNLKILNLLTL